MTISKRDFNNFLKTLFCLFGLVLVVVVVIVAICCYNLGKKQVDFLPYSETYEYTVKGGDTLWSIADDISDGYDLRRVIYEIKKINDLKGDAIYPWDKLVLPKIE